MAIQATINDSTFGVGDQVKVHQKVEESGKTRTQVFDGLVIAIRGKDMGKSFIVRRTGAQNIGIEQIFPLNSPNLEKVEVVRKGKRGARQAKLYYTRDKSRREIETIYTRANRRSQPGNVSSKKPSKSSSKSKKKK